MTPRTAGWPQTRTGKRLAACPGSLPLGGEEARLPDGSLTELTPMRSPEIAVAIEAETRADLLREITEAVERLTATGHQDWWGPATIVVSDCLDRAAVLRILAEKGKAP